MGELTIHLLCNMKKMLILFIGCVVLEQRVGAEQHWRGEQKIYPTSKVRSGGHDGIPHIQGQQNPSKTIGVERGNQRANRQKQQSRKTNQSNHMDHSLV